MSASSFINWECEYIVKRLKKRPSTSSSIFDFYGHGEPNTSQDKANKLIGDDGKAANNLLKDEATDRLNNMFVVKKKEAEK